MAPQLLSSMTFSPQVGVAWYLHVWGLNQLSQLGSWWGAGGAIDAAYLAQVGPSPVFWTIKTGLTVMAGQEAGWPSS